MASLNTLRTKFGIVLSVIIALALLAFIFSSKDSFGFSSNNPKVGVIDGQKIRYADYSAELEKLQKQGDPQQDGEQQADMQANAAWQTLIAQYVLMPGFDRMGLQFTAEERQGTISGRYPSQVMYNAFADRRTGTYNPASVSQYLSQAQSDPKAEQAWSQLMDQVRMERLGTKYIALLRGGVDVNSLEVNIGVDAADKTFSGRLVSQKYASLADSLFTVSSGEIKSYYNSHQNLFKQLPSRTISYVVFDVTPTDADMQALQQTAQTVSAQFAAAPKDSLRNFVRMNRNGQIAENYLTAVQIPDADEAKALTAGQTYGPVLKNNQWIMSRVLDQKMAPDSIGLRQIVLPYTQTALADSLLTALKAGGDFAAAAAQYSQDQNTAGAGGEVGVYPFSAFSGDLIASLSSAKTGDIIKLASGNAIQLLQVYRADKPSQHLQIATITYPVEASTATRNTINTQAAKFLSAARGSVEAFNNAAAAASVTPRVASIAQGDRTIRGMEDSREIVRWVDGAKSGALSEIFQSDGNYVVALLTEIDDHDHASVEKVAPQIKMQLLRDKKYDAIASKIQGTSLEEKAASLGVPVSSFSGVNYSGFYIDSVGVEPRLIGAISTAEKGVVSAPVKGFSGVYLFCVDDIQTTQKQTAEAEKARAQATAESMVQQYAAPAIQQMAKIEDLRGQYF